MDRHASRMSYRPFNPHRREFLKLPLAAGAAGAVLAARPITLSVGQTKTSAAAARSCRSSVISRAGRRQVGGKRFGNL